MKIKNTCKLTTSGVDITCYKEGEANHYFALMVFGMKERDAYKLAYKKEAVA